MSIRFFTNVYDKSGWNGSSIVIPDICEFRPPFWESHFVSELKWWWLKFKSKLKTSIWGSSLKTTRSHSTPAEFGHEIEVKLWSFVLKLRVKSYTRAIGLTQSITADCGFCWVFILREKGNVFDAGSTVHPRSVSPVRAFSEPSRMDLESNRRSDSTFTTEELVTAHPVSSPSRGVPEWELPRLCHSHMQPILIGEAAVDGNDNFAQHDKDDTGDIVVETSISWSAFLELIVSNETLISLGNH